MRCEKYKKSSREISELIKDEQFWNSPIVGLASQMARLNDI